MLVVALAQVVVISTAHAATNGAITVSPAVVSKDMSAGTSAIQNVTIANTTDRQRTIDLLIRDVDNADSKQPDASAYAVVDAGSARYGAGSWIRVPRASVTLAPGARVVLPVRISVPARAPAGSGLAALVVHVRPEAAGAVALATDITQLVLVSVNSNEVAPRLTVSMQPQHRVVWDRKLGWSVRIVNPGPLHRMVTAEVVVSGAGLRRVIKLRPMIIFPESARTLPVHMSASGRPGVVHATVRVRTAAQPPREHVATARRIMTVPWWFVLLVVLLTGVIAWRVQLLRSPEGDESDGSDGLS